MGSSLDWLPLAERLSPDFGSILVDLPGHGESVGLPAEAYTLPWTVEALVGLPARLGVQRAAWVGYSMGGRLALQAAATHPARFRALAMVSAAPGAEDAADRLLVDEHRALLLETDGMERFLDQWHQQPIFASLRNHPELLARLTESKRRNNPLELARALRGLGAGNQGSLWETLDRIPFRVLAVAGALDGKYAETARRMAIQGDHIRAAVLPGCGHTVHLENPDDFLDLLREFLTAPA